MKSIKLCADDYGQNAFISEGILALIEAKRLDATSCLVNLADWPLWAEKLRGISGISCGLHLNFTWGSPLSDYWKKTYGDSFGKLSDLILRSYLGRLNPEIIYAEIQHQYNAFCDGMGRAPDFIDGHQHIHQFPIIRDALMHYHTDHRLSCRYRVSSNGLLDLRLTPAFPKPLIITLLGGYAFKRFSTALGVALNTEFYGVYQFKQSKNYRHFFKKFLQEVNHSALIMCHPGLESSDESDVIRQARYDEYQYFMSDDFLEDTQLITRQPFDYIA